MDLHQPEKGSGDVLVQILWLSVDPYLRGRCECLFLGQGLSGSAASVCHLWLAGLQLACAILAWALTVARLICYLSGRQAGHPVQKHELAVNT